MADLIERLRSAADAYPEDVFGKTTDEDRRAHGDVVQRAAATMGRHMAPLLREAAAALEAAREDACVMPWHRGVPIVRQSIAFDEETEHTPTTPARPPRARVAGGRMTDHDHNAIVAVIDAQVRRGNDTTPEGWNARAFVDAWLDRYAPALGETPRECLQRADGLDRVLRVISAATEGVYL